MVKVKLFSLLLILMLFPFLICFGQNPAPDGRGYLVKVGDKIDDFAVTLVDGNIKKLSEFKAPIVILNFFASWCVVCRKEIPHIEKEIWQPLKDQGVIVIGVDYKEKQDTVKKFIEEMNITYPVALDEEGKIFERFARGGVTRNIVLDQNLTIIFLTRLFDRQEFENMKRCIYQQIGRKTDSLSIKPEGINMEENILKDLADTGKIILLQYQGKHKIHLEGRIAAAKRRKLEIGISLFKEDIVSSKYDKKSKSLRIGYRHYDGMRITILPMTPFKVPRDIEQVIVYDVE